MTVLNRTVFDIPLTWNRTRFEATRRKCRFARKLIESSINVQFEKQMKGVFSHNIDIEENVGDINDHLCKYHDKLRVLDNMIELASQSLRTYFDKRMENIRAIVHEHCNVIQQIIREEAEHWKEIHAVMDQNLLNPGDIRSRNNYPRTVQKSPASYINTIEEEDDDAEEHLSKLVNGKTLTPLLTQMIRKSRLQSKRLTIIPSTRLNIPIIQQERSLPRKEEQFSMHILPLSVTRQPLDIVDTTFVVKPEETILDGDNDEPNGTYRAPNQHYRSQLTVPHAETSLVDSQPNIPPRLCFSPTILQDGTVLSEDELDDQPMQTILLPIDHDRTHIKRTIEDTRRFGQTFLLDIVKTEPDGDTPNDYVRPAIPDDDYDEVVVVVNTNESLSPTKQPSHAIHDSSTSKSDLPVQQESITVHETVVAKSRTRTTTKTKCKPVIVSARKTRSAAKILAEREVAVTAKSSIEKPMENKRKTRKRKQSKSIDPPVETSDDEQERDHPTSIRNNDNRTKTKRRKKSKTDKHSDETSDDGNQSSTDQHQQIEKRSKSKRNDQQQEISNDNNKRKTKKSKERDLSDNETGNRTNFTKRKKTKVSTMENEERKTKEKKRKQKNKKPKNDDITEEQINPRHHRTRSSGKRNVRSS